MLARPTFARSPYLVRLRFNARADALCHTPRREHFSMQFEENAENPELVASRQQNTFGNGLFRTELVFFVARYGTIVVALD
jgi:phosphoenolpyruvate-protein kinase (PTS system EI component)